jgi:predicted RNA-binding protein associated with RNAse of E/G family
VRGDATILAFMPPNALPEITEVKETLAGTRKTFHCHVIDRQPGALVVLFVSKAPVRVHDVDLPAGTVTFGYFWVDRGFNVYHWMSPEGATLAFYVNLAEGTRIEDTLHWRDLTVDILVPSLGEAVVLDEDEIPLALDSATRARIERTRDLVLARAPALRLELEARSDLLWPRVFDRDRRR